MNLKSKAATATLPPTWWLSVRIGGLSPRTPLPSSSSTRSTETPSLARPCVAPWSWRAWLSFSQPSLSSRRKSRWGTRTNKSYSSAWHGSIIWLTKTCVTSFAWSFSEWAAINASKTCGQYSFNRWSLPNSREILMWTCWHLRSPYVATNSPETIIRCSSTSSSCRSFKSAGSEANPSCSPMSPTSFRR